MTPLIECVPNFSEGREQRTLSALADALAGVSGAHLLDVHADPWHHRAVFTVAGDPHAVAEAVFRSVAVAVQEIDLRQHRGVHPRMGAADVVPFVPLDRVSMRQCVEIAQTFAARVGASLELPVFLYARAARVPERASLPALRRPEFEGLTRLVGADGAWAPDFGPPRLHPTAGATAVGARGLLVAYNIDLDTEDVSVARAIAREIRTSSGGLPAVQARGFATGRGAQVSMNLLDIDVTPPATVFSAVQEGARAHGVPVRRSEIVGLVPERALPPDAERCLKLDQPVESRILERRLEAVGVKSVE